MTSLVLVLCSAHLWSDAGVVHRLDARDAEGLALTYQGEAMANFVRGAAREALRSVLRDVSADVPQQSSDVRAAVEQAIKTRIHDALPGVVRTVVYDKMMRGAMVAQGEELDFLVAEIQQRATTSINAQLDPLVSQLYDRMVADMPGQPYVQDIRATIDQFVSSSQIEALFTRPLAESFGEAAVRSVRARIDTALGGDLPPELTSYLRQGPQAFTQFVNRAQVNLPGARWQQLKSKVLDLEVIALKNPIYGSILASSVASHLSKAFKGVFVDPHELKRAYEVGRVLVWQLKNREQITITVRDLAALTPYMQKINLPPMEQWGRLGGDLTTLREKVQVLDGHLQRMGQELERLDAAILNPLRKVEAAQRSWVAKVETTLKDIQSTLLKPVNQAVAMTKEGVGKLAQDIKGVLPEQFNGVPATWEQAKQDWKIPGVLGSVGEHTPLQALRAEHVPGALRAAAHRARRKVSGFLARVAGATLQRLGLLERAAKVLGAELPPDPNAPPGSLVPQVNLFNGELLYTEVDRESETLPLLRHYRSRHDFTGVLGRNWVHSYAEQVLPVSDTEITWFDAQGQKWSLYAAVDAAQTFVSARLPDLQLHALDGQGYRLQLGAQGTHMFAPDGRLQQRQLPGKQQQRVHYDAERRPYLVEHSNGENLHFSYDSQGRVERVRDGQGTSWHYRYGIEDSLQVVERSRGKSSQVQRRYQYALHELDPALRHNLSIVSDGARRAILRNSYGTQGVVRDRVVAQQRPLQMHPTRISYALRGADLVTPAGRTLLETTVRGAPGQEELFAYGPGGAFLRHFAQVELAEK